MANATQAPLKKTEENSKEQIYLGLKFEPGKKYVFELAEENPERELPVLEVTGGKSSYAPHKKFRPFHNLVMTSQIVWENKRRMIRYYDGCDSIFVDQQPKDKETIDAYIKQTTRRIFSNGKFSCYGEDYWLLFYLTICSWNVDSPFRTKTATGIFKAVNPDAIATQEGTKLDLTEKALGYAREATATKMRIHAAYLGIPLIDWDSDEELSDEALRSAYRKRALTTPQEFVDSYGNKSLEVKYYIDKALEKGIISNKNNPNKATWGPNNSVICDISGLKSSEAIAQRLFEFSQSEEGEEFAIQLKSISE